MHAVILAAGRGSRMGDITSDVPKPFLELDGRTLYRRQRDVLDGRVDDVTVVLGYEHENVVDRLSDADAVVVEDWDEYDNAESLRRGLERAADDALVLNGDVLVSPSVVDRVLERFEALSGAYNVVGCLPGRQTEHTAVRCNEADEVVDYGMIPGHRHAGLGVVSERHRDAAVDVLERNREAWYPVLYPETPTKRVVVPGDDHHEINRPDDFGATPR